ncbi:N N'-diacetylbacillosaminyl-diphospho-undecaprenol alpha-1 3-N-acetylgalactosaminyltransferase [termite gut metagenome]|uniref:N N'-diacetylbacillosaminyl-diphospho-undecaprenol alpha-1 3-N-acetylgalactosaminyltransferase n=1 Tax=termite gut metagenome TaxID=433724 RepID=A0A5J4SB27_9ZZZZ
MRILHVINTLCVGGAENLLTEIIPLQNKENIADILLLNGIMTPLKKQLEDNNYSIYSIDINNNIYNPIIIFKIIPYLKKYDLVHVHLFPAQYWVVFAKLISLSKIKIITTEHNTDNRRRHIYVFKYIDMFIYSMYDKVICVSDKTKTNLISYIGLEYNTITIYNGINIFKYLNAPVADRREILDLDETVIVVTMVAGFRASKGQLTLIKAISNLPDNFHLVLVGDGIYRKKCELLVTELNIVNQVHFLGIRTDVPELLKMSDIIVMSSHYEGLSLSSIEGMSVNKPFVASDVDGLHEVVTGAGILFQENNNIELSRILYKLSVDKNMSLQIANKCLQRAKNYDINIMIDNYIKVYKSVLYLPD